ncbi:sensor histidine kinase [Paenibacillus thalictri]|uniref:histidine kinase n=1 Tax=Paenibacillus thalictri TaxID=2527873 RepID=A0A4Q9DHY1_9BACL|nr:HAMP domain-containing sensor histidine kinase [Paenibacillus thalictri]TBL70058.1 HAMP domain-containing histidine kinase [Paenibacillus thalictri]
MSVRMRLTLWYSGILFVVLLLFGVVLYFFLYYYIYDDLGQSLRKQAESVRSRIQLRPSLTLQGNLGLDLVLGNQDYLRNTGTYYQVINLTTGKINKSASLTQLDIDLPEITDKRKELLIQSDSFQETVQIEGIQFLVSNTAITAVQNNEQKLIGVLQAAMPTEQFGRFFHSLQVILSFMVMITILMAASLGWFLARKALRPIDQVIEAAGQIEKGADLENRILYDGPQDEIGRLTSTINGMLGRIQTAYTELEEAYSTQRRFVSDASHELRTPLTTIRGNVDLLEKMWKKAALTEGGNTTSEQMEISLEAMHDIAGEAARMSRLVSDLLSLARADAGVQMDKVEIELRPLLEEVVRKAHMLPRSVEWLTGDFSEAEGVYISGNNDYLQQLLFIFIENAFKYTDEGYVRLGVLRMEDQVGIVIEDTGIGMEKDEVPHIFDRFYRADLSRGQKAGTGLGLSIARWIIDEHQGSIEVKTRQGEGSTFTLWFPIVKRNDGGSTIALS